MYKHLIRKKEINLDTRVALIKIYTDAMSDEKCLYWNTLYSVYNRDENNIFSLNLMLKNKVQIILCISFCWPTLLKEFKGNMTIDYVIQACLNCNDCSNL